MSDDFVFLTANDRTYTRQNISERGIERAGVRAESVDVHRCPRTSREIAHRSHSQDPDASAKPPGALALRRPYDRPANEGALRGDEHDRDG